MSAFFSDHHSHGKLLVRGKQELIDAFWRDVIVTKDEDHPDVKELFSDGFTDTIGEFGYDEKGIVDGRSQWFNFEHFGKPGKQEIKNRNYAFLQGHVKPGDTLVNFVIYNMPQYDFFAALGKQYPELHFFFRMFGLVRSILYANYAIIHDTNVDTEDFDGEDFAAHAKSNDRYDDWSHDDYSEACDLLDVEQEKWESWWKENWGNDD